MKLSSHSLDIFVNTKMDEGPCPKVHSEALKVEFESGPDRYIFDNVVEKEFMARLNDADRTIKVCIIIIYYWMITK